MEAESECEIRHALVRRHFTVTGDRSAIDAALLHHAMRIGSQAMGVVLNGKVPASTVPTKVAAAAVVAPPAPSAGNLRTALGLP